MPKAIKEELLRYQDEINKYYKARRIFLAFGLILLLGPIVAIIPAAFFLASTTNNSLVSVISTLFGLSIVAGIILLILRSALYNQRIKNRKRIIQHAKDEYAIEQMYTDKKGDEKGGL